MATKLTYEILEKLVIRRLSNDKYIKDKLRFLNVKTLKDLAKNKYEDFYKFLLTIEPDAIKTSESVLVDNFAKQMKLELKANKHKGDWRDWKDTEAMYDELIHHQDKLNYAVIEGNLELIKEHLADCANFLLMIGNTYNFYSDETK